MKWMKGSDLLADHRCVIFNFGFKETFNFPNTKLTLKNATKLNIGTFGTHDPSKCSIVVVGGVYLDQVDEVMKIVDKILQCHQSGGQEVDGHEAGEH